MHGFDSLSNGPFVALRAGELFFSKGHPMDGTIWLRFHADRRNNASRAQLLHRIRAGFREMPCLRLTCAQAQRLFGMPPDVCERVFATLVEEGTVTRGPDARYGVRADIAWRGWMPSAVGGEAPDRQAS